MTIFGKNRRSTSPEALTALRSEGEQKASPLERRTSFSTSVTDSLSSSNRAKWASVGTVTKSPSAALGRALRKNKVQSSSRNKGEGDAKETGSAPAARKDSASVAKDNRPKAKARDPDAPRDRRSSYALYAESQRCEVRRVRPDATSKEISRILSQSYRALTPEARAVWEKRAIDDKVRFEREMERYRASAAAAGDRSAADRHTAGPRSVSVPDGRDMTLGELMKQSNKRRGPWYSSV